MKSVIYLSKNINFNYCKLNYSVQLFKIKNYENGITGYLFKDGNFFLQYIEGKKENVSELFDKLQRDPRHKILFYTTKPIIKRRFENWSMNYFNKTTEVEKLFLSLLIKQKKKAIRSTNPIYGLFLKIYFKYKIWIIADQMYAVTQRT